MSMQCQCKTVRYNTVQWQYYTNKHDWFNNDKIGLVITIELTWPASCRQTAGRGSAPAGRAPRRPGAGGRGRGGRRPGRGSGGRAAPPWTGPATTGTPSTAAPSWPDNGVYVPRSSGMLSVTITLHLLALAWRNALGLDASSRHHCSLHCWELLRGARPAAQGVVTLVCDWNLESRVLNTSDT